MRAIRFGFHGDGGFQNSKLHHSGRNHPNLIICNHVSEIREIRKKKGRLHGRAT